MRIAFTVLAWSYPLALHLFIYLRRLDLAGYYLAVLLAWPLVSRLLTLQRPDWFSLLTAILAVGLITILKTHALVVFKILPSLIHCVLFLMFLSSLRSGDIPIITRVAIMMRPELTEPERVYTRKVTIAWSLVFLLMGVVSILLALFASAESWSWFVNVISYFIIAGMFISEFMVRRRVFPEIVDYNLATFLKNMVRVNPNRALIEKGNK